MYRKSKYNNKRIEYDNIIFDSIAEKNRYIELKLLEDIGEICKLECQYKILLQDKFTYQNSKIREIIYIADFKYFDNIIKKWILEDLKGYQTVEFKLKAKLLKYKLVHDKNFEEYEFRIKFAR